MSINGKKCFFLSDVVGLSLMFWKYSKVAKQRKEI